MAKCSLCLTGKVQCVSQAPSLYGWRFNVLFYFSNFSIATQGRINIWENVFLFLVTFTSTGLLTFLQKTGYEITFHSILCCQQLFFVTGSYEENLHLVITVTNH